MFPLIFMATSRCYVAIAEVLERATKEGLGLLHKFWLINSMVFPKIHLSHLCLSWSPSPQLSPANSQSKEVSAFLIKCLNNGRKDLKLLVASSGNYTL